MYSSLLLLQLLLVYVAAWWGNRDAATTATTATTATIATSSEKDCLLVCRPVCGSQDGTTFQRDDDGKLIGIQMPAESEDKAVKVIKLNKGGNRYANNNQETASNNQETASNNQDTSNNQGGVDVPSGDRCPLKPIDCEERLMKCNQRKSGIYQIYPLSDEYIDEGFPAYCDMETDGGGWTVIQRRGDFGQNPDFFYKDWKKYKEGFGDLDRDFWLGNDKIYALSYQRPSAIRFDLEDFESVKRYALYDDFRIDDEENNYKLHVSKYKGDAGDSFSSQDGMLFTTKDKDNDNDKRKNIGLELKGGWWYSKNTKASLNGLYYRGKHDSWGDGVNWSGFKGMYYSLKNAEMKLRSSLFVKL